ncbi:hypothetical protein FA13DRAFT_1789655 [Coprinellus micaceus]|uniref:Uncharacterized protein n=1 Tax=Coprinellus micaceus TaxID=71717 RepID=A0A4Y7TI36_COPMI|nr:hypothetical protein FA13DRAFT_1789655 [Coprinellus micaceus]
MANLIRSARPASEWTTNELAAYNIVIQTEDTSTFLGASIENLPLPQVDPVILNVEGRPPAGVSKSTRPFFRYLRGAMVHPLGGDGVESAAAHFASHLLGLLDYDEPDRVIHQRLQIRFLVSGVYADAQPDVCVLDDEDFLPLVQENKRLTPPDDLEPQLIAQAIAAFYENNRRRKSIGRPALPLQEFAGITLTGTAPIFYKIPITQELLFAINTGQYPAQQTVVHRFIPPVPDPNSFFDQGMQTLENRRVVLKCYEAFKQFV